MKLFKNLIAAMIFIMFAATAFALNEGKGTVTFGSKSVYKQATGINWTVTYTGTGVKVTNGNFYMEKPSGFGNWQDVDPNASNYVMVHMANATGVSLTTKEDHLMIYVQSGLYNATKLYINFKNMSSGSAATGVQTFTFKSDPDGGAGAVTASQPYITVIDATATATVTLTSSNTLTPTRTHTPTNTATDTATNTNTATPTNTATDTGTATHTFTATDTGTNTHTFTETNTFTHTNTVTDTATATHTFTNTATNTNTHTVTETFTPTTTASHTPQVVSAVLSPVAIKGGRVDGFTWPAAVSQYGAQMVYETNISGTPIPTPDGKLRDDQTGNALDLYSTSAGIYRVGSVPMSSEGAPYSTSSVIQESGVTKVAQDMNIVAMSGTPVYSPNYLSSVAGVEYEYQRTAIWAVPDVMIYSITKTAQILTDYFQNGAGLNTTITAAGTLNINNAPVNGTRLLFGAGKALTFTPTSGKSVVIDNLIFSNLTGVTVTMYESITPVAVFSSAGDYLMGFKGLVNEPVYFYSSVSTTPDSIGWIKNREE